MKGEQRDDGTLGTRFKARVVAKKYLQVEVVDFFDTFAPLFKFTSICIILTKVVCFDQHLHQMGEVTAFLYVKHLKIIIMEQPERFIPNDEQDHVCDLSICTD